MVIIETRTEHYCNACHHTTGHAVMLVEAPGTSLQECDRCGHVSEA